MVEIQGTEAAQFLAAAGASGAAMQRLRHRIAVAGMHRADIGRNDMNAAMTVGKLDGHGRQIGRVAAIERRHQRSTATAGQPQRMAEIPIRQQRGNRTEDLEVVDPVSLVRIPGAEQRGPDAAGEYRVGINQVMRRPIVQDLGLVAQVVQSIVNGGQLRAADQ